MFKKSKLFLLGLVCVCLVMCNKSDQSNGNKESIIKGSATILVDETLTPIMEDQVAVFESKYDAKIKIVSKSEAELVVSLFKEKSGIAILTRNLTINENKIFQQKKITPKITKFATDAIAFISNKSNKDTLIELKLVIDYMQGKQNPKIKGLVFDNPNSSTVRFMNELAGINAFPKEGVYSFKTNQEVIKFVAENDGMIGVVGVNWLSQPMPIMQEYVEKVSILSVKSASSSKFYSPSQNNIAEGKYPLARDLYIINAQGYSGLGMGFASFIAGDIGQRIILKSGLLPVRVPGRRINIRNEINNEKK
ncbi:phosphate ABC transporter substrate-binding protein [Flavobacterium franklandianum]|uniref:Phosphate ABC transporter substrate-binding protein n=2 Tax=Flavobacterium franklandianum TaxID=2594430 RepID=A0A553CL59_9FLAO|nr:substrate-binding domain-containing protein [Flavobacterium franklandianum]TRX21145.1 phosphate ABC transporter substrate-binding protein [Flavobacterium franklandianum]TRX29190.1 phosphate ABC transporter substrate-binding protein [Flavobacterium franklandianum]